MKLRHKFLLGVIFLLTTTIAFSLTYQVKTQVVLVNATATKLPAIPLVGREYIQVQNIGNQIVYLGSSTVSANTTSTGGVQLLPYATWYEKYDDSVDIYGKVASGSNNVTIEEGK